MAKDIEIQQERDNIRFFIPSGDFYFNKGMDAFYRSDLQKAKKYLERAVQLIGAKRSGFYFAIGGHLFAL